MECTVKSLNQNLIQLLQEDTKNFLANPKNLKDITVLCYTQQFIAQTTLYYGAKVVPTILNFLDSEPAQGITTILSDTYSCIRIHYANYSKSLHFNQVDLLSPIQVRQFSTHSAYGEDIEKLMLQFFL